MKEVSKIGKCKQSDEIAKLANANKLVEAGEEINTNGYNNGEVVFKIDT